ncbi:MAG: winged helix-turn-helix transcriptional regulator [Deltaproteobacteria bacterium]|nr:winged helix-turn-helix transcriptional regulator [Deltaproteobacteria bacterium]
MKKEEKNLYDAKAKIFKALGHPTRLWITEKLAQGECCVCNLVEPLAADFSTVSKHLSVLKEAGIVEDEKRGKQVYYSLKVPCLMGFMSCVEDVIENRIREHMDLFSSRKIV